MIRKLLTAAVLLIAACWTPALAAVAQDACATAMVKAGNGTTTVTTLTINMTVGTGANRAMTAMLSFGVPTISGVTVVWDQATANQPLTLIKEVDSGSTQARAELWGLVAPASGAHTLTVSWMTFSDIYLDVCSWTGVDQTGGTTSFPGSTSVMGSLAGTSTIPITVTSAVGDYVLAVYSMAGSGVTSVDQTPVPGYGASGFDNTGSGCCNAAANQATGAASVTLTANYGSTFFAVGAATNIKAAGSAPTVPMRQLLGVGL